MPALRGDGLRSGGHVGRVGERAGVAREHLPRYLDATIDGKRHGHLAEAVVDLHPEVDIQTSGRRRRKSRADE
jgi:hypothetical protein